MQKRIGNGRISGEDMDSVASPYLIDDAGITAYDRAEIRKQRAGSSAFLFVVILSLFWQIRSRKRRIQKKKILNPIHERHIRRQYDIARFSNMTK